VLRRVEEEHLADHDLSHRCELLQAKLGQLLRGGCAVGRELLQPLTTSA